MKYVYRFVVYPDEAWRHPPALYAYFGAFGCHTEMEFTSDEFEWFRSEMGHAGFAMRECCRWPVPVKEQV